MVSYQNYQVRQVPIAEAVNRLELVPPNGEMVQPRVTSYFLRRLMVEFATVGRDKCQFGLCAL